MRLRNLAGSFLAAVLLFCSCRSRVSETERKVHAYWVANCQGDRPCTLRFTDVVALPWDRMLVFRDDARQSDLDTALGPASLRSEELSRKIVFMKDGRVLYSEQTPSNVEGLLDGEVVFIPVRSSDDAPVQVFTRDEAVFSVKRLPLSGGGGYCFELTPVHR